MPPHPTPSSPELTRIDRFQNDLLAWGKLNIRSFPWRYIDDPYQVLVSEFMLHRTQAVQVIPVYQKFIQRWPTLAGFVAEDPQEIITLLSPLGLHWRITGMIQALHALWAGYGQVPAGFQELVSVHTIGPYIAGAVLCFSSNQNFTLVDTNTVRVVGRVFGMDISGEARRKKTVISMISSVCPPSNPREFYYALIDLAHLVCHPKNPLCAQCPLRTLPCQYSKNLSS